MDEIQGGTESGSADCRELDLSALRQWAFFPSTETPSARFASPQTYRLLVESIDRRLAIATIALRTPPDRKLVEALATTLDTPALEHASWERLQGEFEAAHGLRLILEDTDLDRDDPLLLTCAVQRALTAAVQTVARGLPPGDLSRLREDIAANTRQQWERVRAGFIDALDPDAVAHVREDGGLTPGRWAEFWRTSAMQRRYRAQAIELFPLLRPLLTTPRFAPVRVAIDAGEPLIEALAAAWKAPKSLVKTLRGVTPADLGTLASRPEILPVLLEDIPPDWWPRTPADWQRCAGAMDVIFRATRRRPVAPINRLWVSAAARAGWNVETRMLRDMTRTAEEIDEFLDILRRALAWTLRDLPGAHVLNRVAAFQAGIGIVKLSKIVRRFGDNYRHAVDDMAHDMELLNGMRWPPIGPEIRQYGALTFNALLTPKALAAEGARMHNCVASYASACMQGRSQIWAVQLSEYPVATLETRITTSGGRPVVRETQLKGVRNGDVGDNVVTAVSVLMRELNAHPEHIGRYLAWRRDVGELPREVRRREALMRPIVAALEHTLTGLWSWPRLCSSNFTDQTPQLRRTSDQAGDEQT